jgi:hypothetical protein
VWIAKGTLPPPFDLDGQSVPIITAYLFHDGGHENPAVLDANAGKSFQGSIVLGMGFTFDDTDKKGVASPLAEMERLIAKDPRNAERIYPYLGGEEANDSTTHAHHRYVINFANFPLQRAPLDGKTWLRADEKQRDAWLRTGIVPDDYPEPVAADWPDLLDIVERKVKPERMKQNDRGGQEKWWLFLRPRNELQTAIRGFARVLVVSRVSDTCAFTFVPAGTVYSLDLIVFPLPEIGFGILQSRVHESWARFLASSMKDDMRYTPTDCFETFPFPAGWETDAALEAAGREYYEARAALMVAHHEGLTKTYNRFHDPAEDAPGIHRLRRLHAALDHAVLAAYGWSDLVETGRCACEFLPDYYDEPEQEGGDPIPKSIRHRWPDPTRDEVLARLLKLNAERAAEEAAEKKREAAKEPRKKSAAKKPAQKKTGGAAPAQGELVPPPQTDMFA